jgi:hypothetical protein
MILDLEDEILKRKYDVLFTNWTPLLRCQQNKDRINKKQRTKIKIDTIKVIKMHKKLHC